MNHDQTPKDGRNPPHRGRGKGLYSPSPATSAWRRHPASPIGSFSNVSSGKKDVVSPCGRQKFKGGIIPNYLDHKSTSDHLSQQDCDLCGTKDVSSDIGKLVENSPVVSPSSKQPDCSSAAFEDFSLQSAQSDLKDKDLNIWGQIPDAGIKDTLSWKGSQCEQMHERTVDCGHSENSSHLAAAVSYDICPVKTGTPIMLKAPLHVQNRIKRNEAKRSMERNSIRVLRSGMLLLKGHITFNDQIKIIKTCRDLGLGTGGFYEPGYRDGGKLHLKMMCLGKNWDPETRKYGDQRPIDGAIPPLIPGDFYQLVKAAIQVSHSFLREDSKLHNVEHILPPLSPNICIVNFYTKSGRLGLHQDKDESKESLNRGLPVVSFSIGDSAEFIYGDQRDPDKAEKVVLESGDVLIFGGKSRLVFHGVATIFPDTAPKPVLEETRLLPGRLNLTFREY